MAELIASGDLQLAADNTHDLPKVHVWHPDSMIVIGDAAHAPSPSSGQGASMANEDGVVLAQCLRDVPGIDRAFSNFERLRRARVERIVAQGARSSSKAAGPIGRIIRDRMLPLLFRYVVTEKSKAWMFEHHVDWNRQAQLQVQ
jgi:2-polyprenyl-6-methoxyphenol hydroxylase-like FAD-dependent oxidoreductase